MSNVRTINLNNQTYYLDIVSNELIPQGDIRISRIPICLDDTVIDCVTICPVETETTPPQLKGFINTNIENDKCNIELEIDSNCEPVIQIDVSINDQQLFTETGGSTDIFFGTSTFTSLTYNDIVNYINNQPNYNLTKQTVNLQFTVSCNQVSKTLVHTFNPNIVPKIQNNFNSIPVMNFVRLAFCL